MNLAGPNDDRSPLGHLWLRERFNVRVPRPYVESYIAPGTRRTEIHGPFTIELYPRSQTAETDEVRAHLRFALRNEPTDLRVLAGAMRAMGPEPIREWVIQEPTGSYSRRAWFFYELLVGELDLEDARFGNYVEALDSGRHITARRRNSTRQRVANNLFGDARFCPTVRRTSRLIDQSGMRVDAEARELIAEYDPATLARAVSYLYTKETRSSFEIEGETPSPTKAGRFVSALRSADKFDPRNKSAVIALQNQIVDPRYAAQDWRDFQNFVGESVDFREHVHFICPRPQDVPDMMAGWSAMTERLSREVDPVVAAAVSAFAFVFVHPFEDGNGRIHRYLVHHVLARTGFSPPGIIFPVSEAIVRGQRAYDEVLETFSERLFKHVDWQWDSEVADMRGIVVENDTSDLYKYFDATIFAEYMYDRVTETVRTDLRRELNYVAIYDRAYESFQHIVDMPNRRASLFIRLCMQNAGRLSRSKRPLFSELTEAEIGRLEQAVQEAISDELPEKSPDLFEAANQN